MFAKNQTGVAFTATGADGKTITIVESPIVAQIVESLRDMSQVMIGEAIAVEELATFLKYGYKTSPAKTPKYHGYASLGYNRQPRQLSDELAQLF